LVLLERGEELGFPESNGVPHKRRGKGFQQTLNPSLLFLGPQQNTLISLKTRRKKEDQLTWTKEGEKKK